MDYRLRDHPWPGRLSDMLKEDWDLRRKYMSALQQVRLECSREIDAVQTGVMPTGDLLNELVELLELRHELVTPEASAAHAPRLISVPTRHRDTEEHM